MCQAKRGDISFERRLNYHEALREVKAGQNAAYTAVESAAGCQYDAPPLRQQRVLPKW